MHATVIELFHKFHISIRQFCFILFYFLSAVYSGPQLSRQNTIHDGKIQFETTNSNYSRQTTNTHGKNKNNYCNLKFVKAREKRSRQEQDTHGNV